MNFIPNVTGKADWIYDEETNTHIPCCSQYRNSQRCGNGPLTYRHIETGDCGEKHDPVSEPLFAYATKVNTVNTPDKSGVFCRCMAQDPHRVGDEQCVYERPGGETVDDSP